MDDGQFVYQRSGRLGGIVGDIASGRLRFGSRERRGRFRLDEAGLLAHLADHSWAGGLVLQPRMVNHPELADINLGALSTLRMVTALDEQEKPELIGAVLRMPSRADSAVDNFHAGGIAAPVDVSTGRLGAASDMGLKPSTRWHEAHPVTGGRIEGRILPYWTEAKTLVTEAHARLGDRVVIGWDVAVLADGPALEAHAALLQEVIGAPAAARIAAAPEAPFEDLAGHSGPAVAVVDPSLWAAVPLSPFEKGQRIAAGAAARLRADPQLTEWMRR